MAKEEADVFHERPGGDGFIEAGEATTWVPAGRSGWEFGANENLKTKAEISRVLPWIDAAQRLSASRSSAGWSSPSTIRGSCPNLTFGSAGPR
jgi:hypothetical protein